MSEMRRANPSPGVNPYVESEGFWEDFHRRFVNYLCEAALEVLPAGYDARIDQRVQLVEPSDRRTPRVPDVGVIRDPGARRTSAVTAGGAGAAILEPVVVRMPELVEEREVWIEVRDLRDESRVTTIEVLSPTNKDGDGLAVYRRKRQQILAGGSHVIDIDLLLGGQRLTFRPAPPLAHFYTYVQRVENLPDVEVYFWSLRDALPAVPIPLRVPDRDVRVDLAAVYEMAFSRGQYPRRLRYDQPPHALAPADRDWASQVAAGRAG